MAPSRRCVARRHQRPHHPVPRATPRHPRGLTSHCHNIMSLTRSFLWWRAARALPWWRETTWNTAGGRPDTRASACIPRACIPRELPGGRRSPRRPRNLTCRALPPPLPALHPIHRCPGLSWQGLTPHTHTRPPVPTQLLSRLVPCPTQITPRRRSS
jgi:hypothetical protein